MMVLLTIVLLSSGMETCNGTFPDSFPLRIIQMPLYGELKTGDVLISKHIPLFVCILSPILAVKTRYASGFAYLVLK